MTLSALIALAAPAIAQSTLQWQPGLGIPGPQSGSVTSVVAWDPDGAGPANERIVVGGSFYAVDGTLASSVAAFDPLTATWTPMSFESQNVQQLLVLPNGDLVAAGYLVLPGTTTNVGVAYWTSQGWQPLGGGRNRLIERMTLLPNGDLIVGGDFLERWNGTAWSSIATPILSAAYFHPQALPNGDLAVAVSTPSGSSILLQSGTTWQTWAALIQSIPTHSNISSMTVMANGDLVVGGLFDAIGGVFSRDLIRYSQGSWLPLSNPGSPNIRTPVALHGRSDGSLLLADYLLGVHRWDGTTWSAFGPLKLFIRMIAELRSGEVLVAGDASTCGVRRLRAGQWQPLASGWTSAIADFAVDPSGNLLATGAFDQAADTVARFVARRDANGWHALGDGPRQAGSSILALPDGDVISGGSGGEVERWDGVGWHTMGNLGSANVTALAVMRNGDLVAGGRFLMPGRRVARWNGSTWQGLGTGLGTPSQTTTTEEVHCLLERKNGDLIAGGQFTNPNSASTWNIARWDGASWASVGPGIGNVVLDLAEAPDGSLLAVADGGLPSGILRWNGSAWSAFAMVTGHIRSIDYLPNGDLLAAGSFTAIQGVPAAGLARWNGSTWTAIDPLPGVSITKLAHTPDGRVHAATNPLRMTGGFLEIQGTFTAHYAELRTTLPAAADPIATSCLGPAGPLVLTAETLPWLGSTFRSSAQGFAPGALMLSITGVSPRNVPLSLILPIALPDCFQLASSEAVTFAVPEAGSASFEFAIPNNPALTQAQAWHQFIQFELSAQGAVLSLSSSNGLHLVVGGF